ncbi:MAG: uroporphyrinogen decarboxylase family protein, partial [Treponema sp.]|nr:uroporphyrinogen decarboxylase family protein [Treponema sp.]
WTNGSDFGFPSNLHMENGKSTVSLNSGACITDWASFENYKWQEPENADYSMLEKITDYLPEGMKLMVLGPSGVMENAIQLAGFDNLCFMIYEDPELAKALFDNIGSRILKHYEIATSFDSVGLVMCNDDWGFKTQTFISPKHLREYVIPWHKKFVELAHSRKIPAVLHSCGNLVSVMDDIIDTIGFDGKHSYEDTITPVEEAYEKWHERIGIIGGLDVNFLVQNDEAVITKRARDMLDRAAGRGAYALGSGNSIPYYVPQDHYFAMIKAALEY